jgi:hypothetical protein
LATTTSFCAQIQYFPFTYPQSRDLSLLSLSPHLNADRNFLKPVTGSAGVYRADISGEIGWLGIAQDEIMFQSSILLAFSNCSMARLSQVNVRQFRVVVFNSGG